MDETSSINASLDDDNLLHTHGKWSSLRLAPTICGDRDASIIVWFNRYYTH